jgi:hypothetical protein
VRPIDALRTRQIGGRSSHSEESLDAARTPAFEHRQPNGMSLLGWSKRAGPSKGTTAQPRVRAATPFYLAPPRFGDARRHLRGSFGRGRSHVFIWLDPGHVHPKVDTVTQRPRDPTRVTIHDPGLATASAVALAGVTARASLRVRTTPPCAA